MIPYRAKGYSAPVLRDGAHERIRSPINARFAKRDAARGLFHSETHGKHNNRRRLLTKLSPEIIMLPAFITVINAPAAAAAAAGLLYTERKSC